MLEYVKFGIADVSRAVAFAIMCIPFSSIQLLKPCRFVSCESKIKGAFSKNEFSKSDENKNPCN